MLVLLAVEKYDPLTHVLVLAQEPPNYNTNTSYWNFTNIIPQLTAFMDATYGKGYQVCV